MVEELAGAHIGAHRISFFENKVKHHIAKYFGPTFWDLPELGMGAEQSKPRRLPAVEKPLPAKGHSAC